jgi:hypothetical protein
VSNQKRLYSKTSCQIHVRQRSNIFQASISNFHFFCPIFFKLPPAPDVIPSSFPIGNTKQGLFHDKKINNFSHLPLASQAKRKYFIIAFNIHHMTQHCFFRKSIKTEVEKSKMIKNLKAV